MRRISLLALWPLLVIACLVAPTSPALAKKPATGFADRLFFSPDADVRDRWLERSKQAGGSYVRLGLSWRDVAPNRPAAPRSPVDPAYSFGGLDTAVRSARARGLRVFVNISNAPDWAEGSNRPSSAPPGTWKPDPGSLGDFAHAVASRYSGKTLDIPRIQALQAWNEPNLSTNLTPQYQGKKLESAQYYRRMLNAFYAGVKSANRKTKVITGGTAPYGDPAGGSRTRPLTFWRKVFCLRGGQRKLKPARCPTKPKLDILAHHPINTSGGPKRSAVNPNDASTPDFGQIRRILRAAERGKNVAPGGRHGLWATELWWDTRPPSQSGVSLKQQARYYRKALPLLARQGAQVVVGLLIRDSNDNVNERGFSSGLYKANGKAKPSLRAWRSGSR